MSGDLEAIGDAVTGGFLGHAVEGDRGSTERIVAHERCLNCGTVRVGRYCHGCGQKGRVHRTLTAIGHDLIHAIFHFDGKFWRTLPLLVWRPGDLTHRYIHGERASFISPLALFLFAVFLAYAVFSMYGLGFTQGPRGTDVSGPSGTQTEIDSMQSGIARELADLDARIARARAAGTDVEALERQRESLKTGEKFVKAVDLRVDDATDGGSGAVVQGINTGIEAVDDLAAKMNENPGLLLYKVQSNAYKFAWALIPLSIPFLWLLYPFSRRFHMFDHFVFVTYSISFMLLWAAADRVLSVVLEASAIPTVLLLFYPPLHIYWQIRGAYRSSRLGSAVRALLLLLFALVIVSLFVMLLFALGAMG